MDVPETEPATSTVLAASSSTPILPETEPRTSTFTAPSALMPVPLLELRAPVPSTSTLPPPPAVTPAPVEVSWAPISRVWVAPPKPTRIPPVAVMEPPRSRKWLLAMLTTATEPVPPTVGAKVWSAAVSCDWSSLSKALPFRVTPEVVFRLLVEAIRTAESTCAPPVKVLAPDRVRPVVPPVPVRWMPPPVVVESITPEKMSVDALAPPATVRVLAVRWIAPEPVSLPIASAELRVRAAPVSTSTAPVSAMAWPPARNRSPPVTLVRPV